MLEAKPEVVTDGVSREVWFAVGVAYALRIMAYGGPITITSMHDGQHMNGSLHYVGQAVDIRTEDMKYTAAAEWARRIAVFLHELGFDVILETAPPHIHIEFDPKPGEIFLYYPKPAVPAVAAAANPLPAQ